MDSYMVRIYRKDERDPQTLIGIVQKVGVDGKEVFSNLDELWSILSPDKKGQGRSKKRNS